MGVLAVRTGTRWRSPWPADDRSSDPRVPGFENVAGAVAAAAALESVNAAAEVEEAHVRSGDYSFAGVGLSAEDLSFLAARRAARGEDKHDGAV